MRLYINGRFLNQKLTGVQRFARETLRAMDELGAEGRLAHPPSHAEILVPQGTPEPALRYFRSRAVGSLQGHAWEQAELPWFARGGFLLGFSATGPVIKRKQLVTMHDAAVCAVPDAYTRAFRTWYKAVCGTLLQVTPSVMTVSQFSKSELCRYFKTDPKRIVVTTEGKEHIERQAHDPDVLAKHQVSHRGYFLAVGSMSAHKNFSIIPRALEQLSDLPISVLIAGDRNATVFGAKHADSHVKVKHVGYVTDAALKTLLSNARAYIHSSKYEGFGLPPLEAMALGCPVIAANAAALPEIAGDAALYFDPDDVGALARHIRRVATDEQLVAHLASAGLKRSSTFSWRTVAEDYWTALGAL